MLRGLETNLRKGNQILLKSRETPKEQPLSVTFNDALMETEQCKSLPFNSSSRLLSALSKRKAELGQMAEQTHCHFVNLQLQQ